MSYDCARKSRYLSSLAAGMAAVATVFALSGPAQADHDDCTALHEAVFMDEPQDVRDLIDHGADVNCLDVLGQTPLVTAVNGASMDSFSVLMDAGANVDVRTEFGHTLLTHTKKKFSSFTTPSGANFKALYGTMVARLEQAGAHP